MFHLGKINCVLNVYWWGRLTSVYGLNSCTEEPILDPLKHYALIGSYEDKYGIRNFFNNSVEEKNKYFADDNENKYYLSDDNNILKNWTNKNGSGDLYLVEYTLIDLENLEESLNKSIEEKNILDNHIIFLENIIKKQKNKDNNIFNRITRFFK
uniref:Uncharacterized protein n=1 Tax=viral metagenome TaxID=1070528 RepID=A0A6C0AE19_9ZZZZ